MCPCCDLDPVDSNTIYVPDTLSHDYTPPYQVWLQKVKMFRFMWRKKWITVCKVKVTVKLLKNVSECLPGQF